MTVSRRTLLRAGSLAAGALAAPALFTPRRAAAQTVTLRLHHFLPAGSTAHKGIFEPWAAKLAAESGNRLQVQIFPSMQLGGAPPQLYDQARDGVVDIIWTLPGYTPGRFPLIETFELPFICGTARTTSMALAEFAEKHLVQEFRDIVPICFWAHDPGHIHTRDKQVRRMEDLRGLKLRFPTRQANEALRALGADTVGMPVPAVPEALSRGTIDGAVIPWEVVPAVRVQELCRFHTEVTGLPGLYSASFVLAMNRRRYDGITGELKRVLDANRGRPVSRLAGEAFDAGSARARQLAVARGNTIIQIDAAEKARWVAATEPVARNWIAAMRQRNVDGAALLAEAKALIAKYSA